MRRPTPLFLSSIALTLTAFALVAGCGGGGDDDEEGEIGQLTNPQDVPTASPWGEPPEVIILDPNAIVPLTVGEPTPTPAEGSEAGVCGPKYTITSGDTFSSIAEKCGSTTQAIRDANPGVDPLTLHPGDVINLPAAPAPSP